MGAVLPSLLENCRGVTQGDPLSCLFFILGLLTVLSPLRASAANVEIPSYLDDLHLLGRLEDVLATFTTFVEHLESVGLTVNQAKTQLYAQRELSSEEMATVTAAGIQLVRREERIKLVEFPLGLPQYVGSVLESRLDTWQLCTEAIKSARRKRGETTTKFYLQFGDPIPTPGKGSSDDSFWRP